MSTAITGSEQLEGQAEGLASLAHASPEIAAERNRNLYPTTMSVDIEQARQALSGFYSTTTELSDDFNRLPDTTFGQVELKCIQDVCETTQTLAQQQQSVLAKTTWIRRKSNEATSFPKKVTKLFPLLSPTFTEDEFAKLLRQEEARIGGRVFGSPPVGVQWEFFRADEDWAWIERNDSGNVNTTLYDISSRGIFMKRSGEPNRLLRGADLANFSQAVETCSQELSQLYAKL